MSRSRREVATVHQRIDVVLSGNRLDAVLGDDLGDQLVVGLEVGQLLLGERQRALYLRRARRIGWTSPTMRRALPSKTTR
jgi:hypothetical protein